MAHVVIQLGHCYRKTGATGTNGVDGDPNEQEFATAAGAWAAELLQQAGHTAGIILADDPAHHYRGDAFVAIHCDGSTSALARGASVGYRTAEGEALAAAWKRHYAAAGWAGFRPDNYTSALAGYYGTRTAVAEGNRAAFIAEAGFLTSPVDEALLTPPGGADRFARALTNAVVEVFGGQPIEEEDVPNTKDEIQGWVREVLDEGTGAGQQGWSNTSKATLAGVQGLHNLSNANTALVLAAVGGVDDEIVAAVADPIADRVVDRVVAALPAGSVSVEELRAGFRDDVRAEVRGAFGDAGTPD